MELIKVNQSRCIKCGICTKICPSGVLCMGENGPEAINPQACIACGQCVAVCTHMAIDNMKTPLNNQTNLKEFPVINAETAQQFLRSRRSIRCYKNMDVPRDQLLKLVNIVRFAPTASNLQGVSYIIVGDNKILKKATEITIEWMEAQIENPSHWSFPYHVRAYRDTGIDKILRDAPYLILATAPKDFKNGRENTIFSFAYLELFATTLGLGSCWAGLLEMCAFANHYPLLELFNIPKDKVLTGAVMVGYPQYSYKRLVDRNPLDVTWLG
ncbi:nitroreductase family protein [Marinisporobacter balticus]|uniref:Nitroreductase n=1 Tax=Marinisporobacter balticus TaxID=2018667 RepID=A0A4R2KEF6_9FIRM|nr:nitroreductase family protein [Marinisporobacter balticus]TCO68679.1 nitroreductase [Marinisporobacter balticus]